MTEQFLITFGIIIASMAAGYLCRRRALLPEALAQWLMTAIAVVGYPILSMLTIWTTHLRASDIWLPLLGAIHMAVMALLALPIARKLTSDRGEIGLFSLCSGLGNCGMTMGLFAIYLLYGERGLGLGNVYVLMFAPMTILLAYPIAKHYTAGHSGGSLGRLLLGSTFDWRSAALPVSILGIILSVAEVPRPALVDRWRLVDILVYGINVCAYFSIGLRLSFSYAARLKRLIAGLALTRFVLGLVVGLALWALTLLTPWPLLSTAACVLIIESFVSTGVTNVAIANMFDLRPREASALFVANTVMYLAAVLPVVMWVFGGLLKN